MGEYYNSGGAPYIPAETQTELDSQLFRVDKKGIFENPRIAKLLTDDSVRSYLTTLETRALYYFASAYVGFVNAGTGEYEHAFDEIAEIVLSDIMFIVNIARSRGGVNISTVRGKSIQKMPEFNPLAGSWEVPSPVPNNSNAYAVNQNQNNENRGGI